MNYRKTVLSSCVLFAILATPLAADAQFRYRRGRVNRYSRPAPPVTTPAPPVTTPALPPSISSPAGSISAPPMSRAWWEQRMAARREMYWSMLMPPPNAARLPATAPRYRSGPALPGDPQGQNAAPPNNLPFDPPPVLELEAPPAIPLRRPHVEELPTPAPALPPNPSPSSSQPRSF